ncbi:MAG: choice-of-anchor D domain-containing protein [Polyangiaceae bacterium]|nr:choice-of-anchor D domain-containing protein [Polyangiaceae bacterium]
MRTNWICGFAAALLALSNGCGGKSRSDPSSSGDTSGGDAGRSGTGGRPADGVPTGGDDTPGGATGGSEAGGTITGGGGSGGVPTAGGNTGGEGTGGIQAAGAPSDGSGADGGASTGGSSAALIGGSSAGAVVGGKGGDEPGTGGVETGGTGAQGGVGGSGGSTPVDASLELDRSRMDFGTIVLGATATDTFTVTNRGASTSGIPRISLSSSGLADSLTTTGCDAALAPGESCSLTISVTPAELGLFDTFVTLTAEPGTDPFLSVYVVGRASGFEVLPPSLVEWGDVPPAVPIRHTATVTATIPLTDLHLWTVGDEFSIDASATTCTDTLAAGASCVVVVEFLAPDLGWRSGMLGIRAGGSSGQIATVQFEANVTGANDLAVEPEDPPPFVAYYEETTDPVVFTVTNVGEAPSGTIISFLVGEFANEYAISDTDCTILGPQETCTVSVVCSPPMSASGAPRDAVLSITDGNTHLSVPVTAQVTFRD